MKKPSDYTKGLIYKIYCNDETITDVYIGSTVDFESRRKSHKCKCNNEKKIGYKRYVYKFIRDNGGWSNWTMIELYKYPCANKRELEQEEDRMMNELNSTLNHQRAFRTREDKKEFNKKYWIDNRETLTLRRRTKIKCINCGFMTSRNYMTEHVKKKKCINYNKPPPDTLDNNKE